MPVLFLVAEDLERAHQQFWFVYPLNFFVKFVNYIEAKNLDASLRANALESCLIVLELTLPIAKKFVNDNI